MFFYVKKLVVWVGRKGVWFALTFHSSGMALTESFPPQDAEYIRQFFVQSNGLDDDDEVWAA
jgi:hypothetical protein